MKTRTLIHFVFFAVCMSLFTCANSLFAQENHWLSLFDGKTLNGWESCENYGSGKIAVENGSILLEKGKLATAIHYAGTQAFPNSNYEIQYKAMRTKGLDFFAALTFPVGGGFCTFINGGWGGTMIGLSSIDGMDASENSSSSYFEFVNKKWYQFRIRTTNKVVQVWIDDKEVITQEVGESSWTLRLEVESTKPLGFSTWESDGLIKDIQYKTLTAKEIKEADSALERRP
ncbi:MAG: DUF1080 domain-containing protein [Planctomycetia bacterium]|nr:DUF1080 domain-containing protein [Planctomycetia bacterium]